MEVVSDSDVESKLWVRLASIPQKRKTANPWQGAVSLEFNPAATGPKTMTIHARNASAIPAFNISQRPFTELRSQINAPQALAYTAAILLAVASATTNLSSAVAKHDSLAGQFIAGSIALAVAALVLIALPAALSAFKARNHMTSGIATFVFILAASYSVTSALGVLGKPRLEAGMHATHDTAHRARLDRDRNAALAELATIAPARQASELNSLIAGKLATSGANGCAKQDGPISTRVCAEVASLQSEASRFERISALSGTVARLDGELVKLGKPMLANSDAAALVAVLAVFGIAMDANAVNVGLMLLAVAILEVGSGLSLAVAQSMRIASPVMRDITPAAQSTPVAVTEAPAVVHEPVTPATAKTAARIVELAKASGGTLTATSQRAVARLAGANPGTTHRALAMLSATGAAVVGLDNGVLVKLAA
jgi:hypothetical protein